MERKIIFKKEIRSSVNKITYQYIWFSARYRFFKSFQMRVTVHNRTEHTLSLWSISCRIKSRISIIFPLSASSSTPKSRAITMFLPVFGFNPSIYQGLKWDNKEKTKHYWRTELWFFASEVTHT